MNYILIGGAWPYANGSLHIGHVAGLLGGDILARYHRLKGDHVLYVSGSDCHGTPITLKARETNQHPRDIAKKNHQAIVQDFQSLNFSYDAYGHTAEQRHYQIAQAFFKALDAGGYVFEKNTLQHYCDYCQQFLADRYILSICPHCGSTARGDECDVCNAPLDQEKLSNTTCAICGNETGLKENRNLYFRLSACQSLIENLTETHRDSWRSNAISLTKRYLSEGLVDRAYSRDLEWGIPVPKEGYEDKTLYIWTENVLGYCTQVIQWCEQNHENPDKWLKASDQLISYYVHAKDNIPFHTIILPSLLHCANKSYGLPDKIISNEYLTLEGQKISTSNGWAIWIKDLVKRYDSDTIRHFLTIQAPEKKDSNFTFEELIHSHNSDLVGQLGNLVNRTLSFINRYFEGHLVTESPYTCQSFQATYDQVGQLIEKGWLKDGYKEVFKAIRKANVLFDREQPWVTRISNPDACKETLLRISSHILNIANLLQPYLPDTSKSIFRACQIAPPSVWSPLEPLKEISPTADLSVLFQRIPKEQIEIERQALNL